MTTGKIFTQERVKKKSGFLQTLVGGWIIKCSFLKEKNKITLSKNASNCLNYHFHFLVTKECPKWFSDVMRIPTFLNLPLNYIFAL